MRHSTKNKQPFLRRFNTEHDNPQNALDLRSRFSIGDTDKRFCLQSAQFPLAYALALNRHDRHTVHSYVGHEPSGLPHGNIALNNDSESRSGRGYLESRQRCHELWQAIFQTAISLVHAELSRNQRIWKFLAKSIRCLR